MNLEDYFHTSLDKQPTDWLSTGLPGSILTTYITNLALKGIYFVTE